MLNLRRTIYKKIDLNDRVQIVNEYLPSFKKEGILTAICLAPDEESPFVVLFYNEKSSCTGSQRCRFEDMKKI